jgi:hypothetical protein
MSRLAYRTDLLPRVLPFFRRARRATGVDRGDLVYYGPMPQYYGVGEVLHTAGKFVTVDFRGTGLFGVHEETLERQYILPIPAEDLGRL